MTKFGSAVDVSNSRRCGKCGLRDRCRDPKKARNYACTFFFDGSLTNQDPSSKAFADMMRDLVRQESILADQYNIPDDPSIALAPNYWAWCTGDNFLSADPKPYPWQIEIGLRLFGDICPSRDCSDADWLEEIPYDCDVMEIPERLSLRVNGVCPNCGKSRLDYIRSGREKDYNSFIGIVGQRCVTGDTLLMTSVGLTPISDWARGLTSGWHDGPFYLGDHTFDVIPVVSADGLLHDATRLFVSEPEKIICVRLNNGMTLQGTACHPIMTDHGWTILEDLCVGDDVEVQFGQNVWGDKETVTVDWAYAAGSNSRDASGMAEIILRSTSTIVCAFLRGLLQCSDGQGFCVEMSRSLAEQVNVVLHNVGVMSSVELANDRAIIKAESTSSLCENSLDFGMYYSQVTSIDVQAPQVTYDVHVPNTHSFIANGFTNHNSGKCLAGSSLVSTPSGLRTIRDISDDVAVGKIAHVSLGGSTYPVTASKTTENKPVIRVLTRLGYEIECTVDHPLKSPIGFIRADRAKDVMIETYHVPFPNATELAHVDYKSPSVVASRLSKLSRDDFVDVVTNRTTQESSDGTHVYVTYTTEQFAHGLQTFLLSKGIICGRVASKLLMFKHPYSQRYADIVGLQNNSVRYVAERSANLLESEISVGHRLCVSIEHHIYQLAPEEFNHPEHMRVIGVSRKLCREGTFSKKDALSLVEAMRHLHFKDGFAANALVQLCKSAASDSIIVDDVNRREKIGRTTVYDIEVPETRSFVANGMVVHNSTGIGMVLSYHQHQLLKLKNPSAFYRIKSGTVLTTTVTGTTYGGAKKNVYEPLLATIQNSNWFKSYFEILDDVARRVGEDELYRVKDSLMFFRTAGLYTAPASPSRRNLRGATRCAFVVDEISHFSSDKKLVNISGMEIWDALAMSLNTIRPAIRRLRERGVINIPPGLSSAISSPYEVSDPGMVLFNAAQRSKNMYYIKRPTWEANPGITFEDLADDFAVDSVAAWRNLGCRPAHSANAFVANISVFKNVIDRRTVNAVMVKTVPLRKNGKLVAVTAKIVKWNWRNSLIPKIMAVDAGHVNNAFAVAVAHVNEDEELVYDAFVEIRPRDRLPVSHKRVYRDVIVPLIKMMNVKVVVGDRWQHIRLTEELSDDHGISYIPLRLTYAHFTAWRDDLLRGQWVMPRPEMRAKEILNISGDEYSYFDDQPVSRFIRQCVRVVDVPGKTVDKPSVGSDDVFRTAVLAHASLGWTEVTDLLTAGDVTKASGGPLGAVSLGSGSGLIKTTSRIGTITSLS